ncbi:MAG TPA: hypothetical protein DCR44_00525 [Acholeplasmatales bacterium]|nr:MAG: hypothetical protein A2Y16_02660 [Tenericutes bacterium GWF2_57_13]HAQ55884.1 hypothetical protein [Acholeplasmatales bacterium]
MNILILYDTVFGNTKKIAEAVADGFSAAKAKVRLIHAGEAVPTDVATADLVVVGSPTRAFRPTAATMKAVKNPLFDFTGKKFAAFDTRIDPEEIKSGFFRKIVTSFGYAADAIEKTLLKRGAVKIAEAHPFIVTGDQGTVLRKRETETAFDWARTLLANAGSR